MLRASFQAGLPFLALCGCTTLGPMPAMTGVPVPPIDRPGVELQAGIVPGYYLSSTVVEDKQGSPIPQLLGLLEPDELISVPGLFAGARYAGDSDEGAALEPLVGYRTHLDDDKRIALGLTSFLSYASEEQNGAAFSALRAGLDAGLDANLSGISKYAELHANLGLTLTGLDADGRYCVDPEQMWGRDCSGTELPPIPASVSGVFPSAHGGASLEFARHLRSGFHGLRLGFDVGAGAMPTVVAGEQRGMKLYLSGGLTLSAGVGATE
jgi:hypothetical protein